MIEDSDLQRVADEWLAILGMSEWDVRTVLSRDEELRVADAKASCDYSRYSLEAVIQILDPELYDGAGIWDQLWERSVLHELLHILLSDMSSRMKSKDAYEDSVAEERVVVRLSRVMHRMKQGYEAMYKIAKDQEIEIESLKRSLSNYTGETSAWEKPL